MKMRIFIARRIILMIPVVFGILFLTFTISNLLPNDPLIAILGEEGLARITDFGFLEELRHYYGLDRPLHEQFLRYISNIFRGNLGVSLRTRRPVLTDIIERFPATIELAIFAWMVSIIIGIPLGIISAIKKNKIVDHFSRFFSLAGVCLPSFWLGLIMLLIFYYHLGWLPPPGRYTIYAEIPKKITGFSIVDNILLLNWKGFVNSIRHLILPAFCLGLRSMATLARQMRSSLLEVMGKDYIRTARSKGLIERIIIIRHALKNAMIPTVTVAGIQFGFLLGGSILVETVFGWPGIGLYSTLSVIEADFPAIMGVSLIFTLIFSFANLFVDLIYSYLDPRIIY